MPLIYFYFIIYSCVSVLKMNHQRFFINKNIQTVEQTNQLTADLFH